MIWNWGFQSETVSLIQMPRLRFRPKVQIHVLIAFWPKLLGSVSAYFIKNAQNLMKVWSLLLKKSQKCHFACCYFLNEIYKNRSLWEYIYSFLVIFVTFGHSVVEQYFTVAKLLNGVILALVCRVCLLCLTNHSVYCQFSWALLAVFKINDYDNLQNTLF